MTSTAYNKYVQIYRSRIAPDDIAIYLFTHTITWLPFSKLICVFVYSAQNALSGCTKSKLIDEWKLNDAVDWILRHVPNHWQIHRLKAQSTFCRRNNKFRFHANHYTHRTKCTSMYVRSEFVRRCTEVPESMTIIEWIVVSCERKSTHTRAQTQEETRAEWTKNEKTAQTKR